VTTPGPYSSARVARAATDAVAEHRHRRRIHASTTSSASCSDTGTDRVRPGWPTTVSHSCGSSSTCRGRRVGISHEPLRGVPRSASGLSSLDPPVRHLPARSLPPARGTGSAVVIRSGPGKRVGQALARLSGPTRRTRRRATGSERVGGVADRPMRGEAHGQGERPLFALTGVMTGIVTVQQEDRFVAMWSHGGHATIPVDPGVNRGQRLGHLGAKAADAVELRNSRTSSR
jgi:hypothetical protein